MRTAVDTLSGRKYRWNVVLTVDGRLTVGRMTTRGFSWLDPSRLDAETRAQIERTET